MCLTEGEVLEALKSVHMQCARGLLPIPVLRLFLKASGVDNTKRAISAFP